MVLAIVAIVIYLTSSTSMEGPSLNVTNFAGLFDPRPEELDEEFLKEISGSNQVSINGDGQLDKAHKPDDPANPGHFLGDISEVDPFEERPKTNSEDPDLEQEQLKKNSGSDDDILDGITNKEPATIPEKPYPQVAPISGKQVKKPLEFRIYSHNIKNGEQRKLAPGESAWRERKDDVAASIKLHLAPNTIVVLQEALNFQLEFILQQLNLFSEGTDVEWVALGGGGVDGKSIGEYVPIIVRKKEWDIVYQDTFWLNDKLPRIAVTGWDAKYLRICTYATLRNKESGAFVNLFNTNFDHKGKQAREESAKLVAEKMLSVNEWPSILTGDLNFTPENKCYQTLSQSLHDVHRLTSRYNRYGHRENTVTGFLGAQLNRGKRIDYIFAPIYTKRLSEEKCPADAGPIFLQLQGYGLLHSKYGGKYMSDHRPLMADFILGRC